MATRVVTGLLRLPDGSAYAGAAMTFRITPNAYSATETVPSGTVTETTAVDGTFSATLWCNLDAIEECHWRAEMPDGESFTFDLPAGGGSVSLESLRVATMVTSWDTDTIQALLDAKYTLSRAGGTVSVGADGDTTLSSAVFATTAHKLALHLDEQIHGPYWGAIFDGVTFRRGAIALRFDDGRDVDYDVVYPLLTARNLVASFAVPSARPNTASYMTTAELLAMQSRGMEITCHSASHGTDPLTVAAFIAETVTAKASLEALGLHINSFTQPGTWTTTCHFNTAAQLATIQGRVLRSAFANLQSYVPSSVDFDGIRALPMRNPFGAAGTSGFTLATAKQVVDHCSQYGGGAVLYLHSASLDLPGNLTTAEFTDLLDYIATDVTAGKLVNLTPTGMAFARQATAPANIIFDPSFELQATGTLVGWRPYNGAPTIVAGGRTGTNCAQVNHHNSISQQLIGSNLRSLRVSVWAKTASPGTPTTSLVYVQAYDTGQLNYGVTTTVGDNWQQITFTVGAPIASGANQDMLTLWLFQAGDAADVLYDDVVVEKI
jgi:peptidoglycan/xylan/chitin deacetylase (PgdA/CDA1 family)